MSDTRLRVLLTGPGGRIGPHILPDFAQRYDLKVLDRRVVEGFPETIVTDLQDPAALEAACEGVDVVVHLAATSDEAPFVEELVPNNVVGLYNVFEAARKQSVRRVVFASTVQAVGFHERGKTIRVVDGPRPVTLYGCTKALGEVMGRYYHDRHGLEFVGVRIGWFQNYDSEALRRHRGARDIWLSPHDCAGILCAATEKPGVGYAVVHATSRTETERLSRDELREALGYEPVDDVASIPFEAQESANA